MVDSDGVSASPDIAGLPPGTEARDFDAAYDGKPPWDIDRPQPALAELLEAGGREGNVLDAGCGTGEHALLAAGLGLEATGIDSSPKAIDLAREKAKARGVACRFILGDALELGSLGEQFVCVIDSGLFHVFDDRDRARYADNLRAAMPSGGRYFLLCFSEHEPGTWGPRRVTKDEIRLSFSDGWRVDSIDEVRMIVNLHPAGVAAWRAAITRIG